MRKVSLALMALVILGVICGVVRMGWAENPPSPLLASQGKESVTSKTEITVKGGKVSVDLVEADLGEVLKKFSQAAGIEITVGEGVSGKVNMKFSDLSLREGLEKIIGQSDYALEYTGEGLSKVKLTNKKGKEVGKQAGTGRQAEGCKIEYNEAAKVLRFLDCKGKVIKQVDTKCSRSNRTKNNKYIAMDILVADTPEAVALKTKEGYRCGDEVEAGYGHSEILLMDNAGNLLWSKRIAGQRLVERIIMSDNAEAVVFLTGEADEGFSDEQLNVLNSAGEEILLIPKDIKTAKKNRRDPLEYKLSDNGKYLGIEFDNRTEFYDLENGTSWELPEWWGIHSIANDGHVKLFFEAKHKEIDLKDYLETK